MALDTETVRRLLPECGPRSMMGTRLGLAAYDGRCLAEAYAREKGGDTEAIMAELQAWANSEGGDSEWRQQPTPKGLRPGRKVAPAPGPPVLVLWLPREGT